VGLEPCLESRPVMAVRGVVRGERVSLVHQGGCTETVGAKPTAIFLQNPLYSPFDQFTGMRHAMEERHITHQ